MKEIQEMISELQEFYRTKPAEFILGLALNILLFGLLYIALSI